MLYTVGQTRPNIDTADGRRIAKADIEQALADTASAISKGTIAYAVQGSDKTKIADTISKLRNNRESLIFGRSELDKMQRQNGDSDVAPLETVPTDPWARPLDGISAVGADPISWSVVGMFVLKAAGIAFVATVSIYALMSALSPTKNFAKTAEDSFDAYLDCLDQGRTAKECQGILDLGATTQSQMTAATTAVAGAVTSAAVAVVTIAAIGGALFFFAGSRKK
ncbi:MAG: hypothetical protein CMM76_17475 [Rhodospirillaceae bacterium]|nr:hypothetical protein [Rhodospirillaceae bacterium]|tara:strand:+ start:74 stop:745 length:672 start_codon:yes stop_codon:yes gene_type:complete